MASRDSELTDDAFLGGSLRILQPRDGYRAGMDAVLAAAAVPAAATIPGLQVLDVGAGVGVLGLCVARRLPNANVTLVEIDPELAQIAAENASRNGLASRTNVIVADATGGGPAFDHALGHGGLSAAFQHVVSNPPYAVEGEGTLSPELRRARAHSIPPDGLDGWIRFMTTACANGGTLVMINRTEAMPDVLHALDRRFGATEILPLHARAGEPARRFIVRAIKGSRAPLRLLAGRVIHSAGQDYAGDIEAVLRTGAPLSF